MPPVYFLIKPASSNCNLRCEYCFYQSEALGRKVASYGLMTEETLETIVRKGLEYADRTCGFAFQGGEPTLAGLSFFERLIALERKYVKADVRIMNSIQTNGMLIDENWSRFLHDHRFLVGLSLDGPKDVHDLHRVDAHKEDTFGRVMKAAELFNRYQVEYNILSVVTSNSARHADRIYYFYKKNKFHYLQFINCLDPLEEGHGRSAYSLKPADLEKFLKRLFDRWYEDLMNGEYVSIRYFDNLVGIINGREPEACGMSGICSCNCAIEADSSMYPCDFYMTDSWCLGNIHDMKIEEMLQSKTAERFIKESAAMAPECQECRWRNLCRGGCRRERDGGDSCRPGLNRFCSAYRGFFDYAYDRLVRVARAEAGN